MTPDLRSTRAVLVASILCLSIAVSARAQTAADSTNNPTNTSSPALTLPSSGAASLLQKGVSGELLALVVPRSEQDLQRLIGDATGLAKYAELEAKSNRDLSIAAEGRAKIMASEMDVTKTKRDTAKKMKDNAAATELDLTYKRQESEYKYLLRVRDAMQADADRLATAQVAANAQTKALEQEMALVRKQAQIGSSPSPQDLSEFRVMLRSLLESQREAVARTADATAKRKKVIEERLKQLDALAKLGQ